MNSFIDFDFYIFLGFLASTFEIEMLFNLFYHLNLRQTYLILILMNFFTNIFEKNCAHLEIFYTAFNIQECL